MPRLALVALLLLGLGALPALAASAPLTAAEEARAVAIGSQLRCVVCQNESVEASRASLAVDMRRVIREQVAAGRTNQEIMHWMEARYGQFIRLDPPFEATTWLLWSIPVLAPIAGVVIAIGAYRMHRPRSAKPLSEAEQARLNELLE